MPKFGRERVESRHRGDTLNVQRLTRRRLVQATNYCIAIASPDLWANSKGRPSSHV